MKDLLDKYKNYKITHDVLVKGMYPELIKARGKKNTRDIVMYSYKWNIHDHINDHEMNRIIHSVSSLRKFNKTIPVYLFCSGTLKHQEDLLIDKYGVTIRQFNERDFDHEMLIAWSIHRWYNLKFFKKSANILYVDSDTIFYHDPKYLFDTPFKFSFLIQEPPNGKNLVFSGYVFNKCSSLVITKSNKPE